MDQLLGPVAPTVRRISSRISASLVIAQSYPCSGSTTSLGSSYYDTVLFDSRITPPVCSERYRECSLLFHQGKEQAQLSQALAEWFDALGSPAEERRIRGLAAKNGRLDQIRSGQRWIPRPE
jgi:hypothetical protein